MIYRIRYIQAGRNQHASETIEANSPAEAMVKFSMTRGGLSQPHQDIITSVLAEESALVSQW